MPIPRCGRYCVHFVFTTLGYHPESVGGAFRYVAAMAEGLARRGHVIEAIYPAPRRKDAPKVLNGVSLHRLNTPRNLGLTWFDRNRDMRTRIADIRKSDRSAIVVSCHGYFVPAVLQAAAPMVSLFTGPWAEEFLAQRSSPSRKSVAFMMRLAEKHGLNRSSAVFTISKYFEANLKVWHPGLTTPIHNIEGGVDLSHFQPTENREEAQRNFGVAAGEFVFLAVRRLEPRMGLIDLIDAFAVIQTEFPTAQLWIAGTGSLSKRLEQRARETGARVKLLGFVAEAELPLRYAAADCTVMPSLDLEGFGLSTVESLACAAPVIGSNRGATPEILEPLDKNLLYDSQQDLVDKLRAILSRSITLPTRERCREYASTRYSWDRPVEIFEKTCAKMFGGES